MGHSRMDFQEELFSSRNVSFGKEVLIFECSERRQEEHQHSPMPPCFLNYKATLSSDNIALLGLLLLRTDLGGEYQTVGAFLHVEIWDNSMFKDIREHTIRII